MADQVSVMWAVNGTVATTTTLPPSPPPVCEVWDTESNMFGWCFQLAVLDVGLLVLLLSAAADLSQGLKQPRRAARSRRPAPVLKVWASLLLCAAVACAIVFSPTQLFDARGSTFVLVTVWTLFEPARHPATSAPPSSTRTSLS